MEGERTKGGRMEERERGSVVARVRGAKSMLSKLRAAQRLLT